MTSRNNAPGLSLLPRGNSASYRVPLSPSPKEKYPFVSCQRWKLSCFSLFLNRLCRASGSRPRAFLSYPVSRCATFSSILRPFSSNNSHLCTTLYTVEPIIITSGLKCFSSNSMLAARNSRRKKSRGWRLRQKYRFTLILLYSVYTVTSMRKLMMLEIEVTGDTIRK